MSENIKKAKYRVKNAEGAYDVVYLETSMDQVEGLNAEFQSVGAEIDAVEAVATGLSTRLDKAEGDIVKEISDREAAITGVQEEVSKVSGDLVKEVIRATMAEEALGERVTTLEGQVGTDLDTLRETVAGNTAAIWKEVSDREKEITRVEGLVSAEAARAKAEEQRLAGLINTAQDEVDALEVVVRNNKEAIEGTVSTLEGTVATHGTDIETLKAAVSDKNSNTLVFATMEEFHEANLTPKVGDLAFVLDIKKAFIYKGNDGAQALDLPVPPQGWIYFDEISTEIDLRDYAKISFVEGEVAKLVKADSNLNTAIVAEASRAEAAEGQIASNLELEVLRAKAAEGVNAEAIADEAIRAKAAELANTNAINKEVSNRQEAVTAVQNKVVNNATVVGSTQPVNGDLGHVWLETQA